MTSFVFGGGCFWCLDAVYRQILGVNEVISGYAGGDSDSPDYNSVASGKTGHAEVVKVTFDGSIIPPETILDIFFVIHDPTTLNRQGADRGTQYRSVMLYDSSEQNVQYEAARIRAEETWGDEIVTEIAKLNTFYEAEPEHQDYFANNPTAGYCSVVIAPKVSKARQLFKQWMEDES